MVTIRLPATVPSQADRPCGARSASDGSARLATDLILGDEPIKALKKVDELVFVGPELFAIREKIREKDRSRQLIAVPFHDDLSDGLELVQEALATADQTIEPASKRLDLFCELSERLVRVHDTNFASAATRLGISGSDQMAGFLPASSM